MMCGEINLPSCSLKTRVKKTNGAWANLVWFGFLPRESRPPPRVSGWLRNRKTCQIHVLLIFFIDWRVQLKVCIQKHILLYFL